MAVEFRILGCGSSGGVPRIGNQWGACDPANPKNHRTRCSLLVSRREKSGATHVLIDTSPDMRTQLLAAQIGKLDAVFFTHDHADQTHGIDDLRPLVYLNRTRIPVWMDEPTQHALTRRFSYCFTQPKQSSYPSILEPRLITEDYPPIVIEGAGGAIVATPFRVHHGRIDALGFRINNTAYTPDMNNIPDTSHRILSNLSCWIVDALRREPHPTHAHLAHTLALLETYAPRTSVLTNMHIDMDYATLCAELPPHIRPAYDGMVIVENE